MLFKNAILCDYQGVKEADLRTQNGLISHIGSLSPMENEKVLDMQGKILFPAMIDVNIAPKALSLSSKALISLAQKALKGGVGTILLNPYTNPPCSENGSIELIKSLNSKSPIHLLPAINPLTPNDKLSDISSLHQSGGKAIFAKSDYNAHTFMRIAQYAQMLHIPLVCFAQDSSLADGVMNEGLLSAELGLPSIPTYSQTKEIPKIAEMLKDMPLKLIFHSLVYPRSFELLESYKNKGYACEFFTQSSIHHLLLDESLCQNYNTAAKLNPPLVDSISQKALLEKLKNGEIDLLSSLQSADYNSKKDQVFELASFGIDALESYLSLLYTFLHKSHKIPLEIISKLTSFTPSQILGLNKGALQEGRIAELVLFNPHKTYICSDTFSPYYQQELCGVVEAFLSNEILHDPNNKL